MEISFENVWAKVLKASTLETEWLDLYLSCEYRVYTGSPNYEPERRYCLFDRATRLFPSGLIKMVKSGAKRDGIELNVLDARVRPCAPELDESLVPWLWEHQTEAIWEAIKKGGRGLIKSPTGSGKTEIMIGLTRVVPCEWLMVVHRTDLVDQAAERFALRTKETAGRWNGGVWHKGTSNFTVSSFQALAHAKRKNRVAYLKFVENIQAVAVDEVHAQPADSFYGVTLDLKNAFYRIGLSGTPLDRAEKENLRTVGALGPVLYEISYERLRALGILSQSEVVMVTFKHDKTEAGASWQQVYKTCIVHNVERNRLLADLANLADKPCLLFVDEIQHGEAIANELTKRGLRWAFADGGDWLAMRQAKIKDLVAGRLDVLLCTVIFQEGVDIPELRSVVVGGAKSSAVATLQRMGRGMRTAIGKDSFQVWDVLDRNQTWLTEHATARKNAYEDAGHRVEEKKIDGPTKKVSNHK